MTELRHAFYKNLFGIAEQAVDLSNQGVVLIVGKNGQGKTSLFIEGPYYMLFGQSFEHGATPGTKVVKRDAKTSIGALELDINGQRHVIIRSRGVKSYEPTSGPAIKLNRSGVFLFKLVGEGWSELSEASGKDTQELINNLIDLTPLTFTRSSLFSSDILSLPDLPDTEKKRLLHELLGVGSCDVALKTTSSRIAELVTELQLIGRDLSSKTASVTDLKGEVAEVQADRDTWESEQADAEAKLKKQKTELEQRIKDEEAKRDAAASSSEQASAKLPEIVKQLGTKRTQLKKVQSMFEQLLTMKPSTSVSTDIERRLKLAQGGICSSCNRPFDEAGHDALHASIEKLQSELTDARLEEALALKEYTGARQQVTSRRASLETDIETLDTQKTVIERQVVRQDQAVATSNLTIANLNETIDRLTVDEPAENPYDKPLASAKARLGSYEKDVERLAGEVEARSSLLEDERLLGELFGPKGCRVSILQESIPFLNAKCAEVGIEMNSSIDVSLRIREEGETHASNLEILVDNPNGNLGYHGNSAGERRLVDLILLFAFFSLAGASHGSLGQAFFDETFEKLHPSVKNDVLRAISLMNKKRNSVFIISHVTEGLDLDLISQIWEVEGGVVRKLR